MIIIPLWNNKKLADKKPCIFIWKVDCLSFKYTFLTIITPPFLQNTTRVSKKLNNMCFPREFLKSGLQNSKPSPKLQGTHLNRKIESPRGQTIEYFLETHDFTRIYYFPQKMAKSILSYLDNSRGWNRKTKRLYFLYIIIPTKYKNDLHIKFFLIKQQSCEWVVRGILLKKKKSHLY